MGVIEASHSFTCWAVTSKNDYGLGVLDATPMREKFAIRVWLHDKLVGQCYSRV